MTVKFPTRVIIYVLKSDWDKKLEKTKFWLYISPNDDIALIAVS